MSRQARSIYFPYCLRQLDDGHWIILNRDYKPLGGHPRDFYDYEDIPSDLRIKSVPPKKAEKLSFDGSGIKDGFIYLYSDGSIPTSSAKHMSDYCERIAILMALKTVTEARNS